MRALLSNLIVIAAALHAYARQAHEAQIPDVDEIIAWYEPLPTIEDLLAPMPEADDAPWKRTLGDDDRARVEALESAMDELADQGRFAEASTAARKALEIRIGAQGATHPDSVDLRAMADSLLRISELPDEKRKLEHRARELDQQSLDEYNKGNIRTALELLVSEREARRAGCGVDSWGYATNVRDIAQFASQCGQDELAQSAFREAILRRSRVTNRMHPSVASTIMAYALHLNAMGDFTRADKLARISFQLDRAAGGPNSPAVAYTCSLLAVIRTNRNEMPIADRLFRKAVEIARMDGNQEDQQFPEILFSAGTFERMIGRYRTAELFIRESLVRSRARFGDDHPATATKWRELGQLLDSVGNSEPAERAIRTAIRGFERSLGPNDQATILCKLHLGTFLEGIDRTDEAEALVAAPEFEAAVANCGDLIARCVRLRLLGQIRLSRNDNTGAIAAFRSACELLSEGSLDRGTYGVALVGLAIALDRQETPESRAEAIHVCGKAIEELRKIQAPVLYDAQMLMGELLMDDLSRQAEAESHIQEAIRLYEHFDRQVGGDELDQARAAAQNLGVGPFPDLARIRLNQAESARGPERDRLLLEAFETIDRGRGSSLRGLIGRGAQISQDSTAAPDGVWPAERVADNLRPTEIMLLYLVTKTGTDLLTLENGPRIAQYHLAWPDGKPMSRQSILDAATQLRLSSSQRVDAERLRDLRSAFLPAGLDQRLVRASNVYIVPDRSISDLPFELLFADSATGTTEGRPIPVMTYGVSPTLLMQLRSRKFSAPPSPEAILVGGPLAPQASSRVLPSYARASDPEIGTLVIGVEPGGIADAAGLKTGDVLTQYGEIELRSAADLSRAISGSTTPLASQSTAVNPTVSVTVWRDGAERRVTVPAGRLGVRVSPVMMPDALAVARELETPVDQRDRVFEYQAIRQTYGDLPRLPGSRIEIKLIEGRLNYGRAIKPVVLLGDDADREALDARVKQPRILHFATHAIGCDRWRVRDSALVLGSEAAGDAGLLRLSDLVHSWKGRLNGTDLVVLSGCQTVGNKATSRDGIVGLTWGFLYAGADSVIASLWKVDDGATVLLMDRFYENLLGQFDEPRGTYAAKTPMSKAQALTEAKMWLRARTPDANRAMLARLGLESERLAAARGEAGPGSASAPVNPTSAPAGRVPTDDPATLADAFDYSHPRFWAGFILMGNPD
ncbi:MAG: hypothetical protein AMXMBFR47_36020 [Planctomycetota bacterium]